jgi:hypothetical protein
MVIVPALRAEVHAREADDERAEHRHHHDSHLEERDEGDDGDHDDGELDSHHELSLAPHHHHHHHDGDDDHDHDGDHGHGAPEHLAVAVLRTLPPAIPPAVFVAETIALRRAGAPLSGARRLDAHRNRGPPSPA